MFALSLSLPHDNGDLASEDAHRQSRTNADYKQSMRLHNDDDGTDFPQVYYRHQEFVHRICRRICGVNDAADVAQKVFLILFRSLDRFHGEAKFETWLYRITVNECLQHLRHERRRRHPSLEYEAAVKDKVLAAVEERELLELALAKIDPELRTIFLLREVEQQSYREIANTLRIPAGTVASRLNHARHELQAALRTLGWRPS
jgi:RNA polymerase sigma-70 factor (ECF subfamily)